MLCIYINIHILLSIFTIYICIYIHIHVNTYVSKYVCIIRKHMYICVRLIRNARLSRCAYTPYMHYTVNNAPIPLYSSLHALPIHNSKALSSTLTLSRLPLQLDEDGALYTYTCTYVYYIYVYICIYVYIHRHTCQGPSTLA